jgi:hypothetical protein
MKEVTVVRRVGRMFTEQGFEIRREVAVGPKRIDLAALNPHSGEVTAVEAKVEDWHAGLKQAMIYRICANRVYLAVEERFAPRIDFGALRPYGIGAIAVDGAAHMILKARPSTIVHPSLLQEVRGSFSSAATLEGGRRVGCS